MRALVIGGGIAGPVLAVALRRAGLDATVFEAGTTDQDHAGAFLQLAPNGVNALAAVGLERVLDRAGGFATSGIRFANARGQAIGEIDSRDELERYGAANALVKRGALHAALRDAATAHGVDIAFGKRLVRYAKRGDGVEASFADGTTALGDMLIGCDGIRSRTRELLLRPGPRPRYAGLMNLGGFAQARAAGARLDDSGVNHMVFGRTAFFGHTTATATGEVYWFSNIPGPREPAGGEGRTLEQWLELARSLHAHDPAPIPDILAGSPPPVGAWPIEDLPALPTWHDDRVCLVGDAAHAMSPSAGQGASVALEDAVVLAKCLRGASAAEEAFAQYESLRRPRAETIAKQARRNTRSKLPGPVGGWLRDRLLPVFLRLGAKQAAATHGHNISWEEADHDRPRA